MIPRHVDEITADDLRTLIASKAEEGVSLDFKRDLPGEDRDARKEFLADVCAFANTNGGDLIYGIDEAEGVASAIVGHSFSADDVVTKLTNVVADGLEPRLHGVAMKAIVVDDMGGQVLLLRVPRSYSGIHRSARDNHFWVRESRSKRQLDVPGITSRISEVLGREDRVADFFAKRYVAIGTGTYPLALNDGLKVVIHLLPARGFLGGEEVDLSGFSEPGSFVVAPNGRGSWATPTFDGVLHHPPVRDGRVRAATMLFRSGVVEGVEAPFNSEYLSRFNHFSLETVEDTCVGFLEKALPPTVRSLSGGFPLSVRIALVQGADRRPGRTRRDELRMHFDELPPIRVHSPVLVLADLLVESKPRSVPLLLRPVFDRLWQAWGYPRSYSYVEEDGKVLWSDKR